jgi:uncharacterized protein (DUF2141 family)
MLAGTLALLLTAAPPAPMPAPPRVESQATLAYAIEGVRSSRGELVIAVYTSKLTWLDLGRAAKVLRVPAMAGTMWAAMEGLPVGDCAVLVFHDENGNGKLDAGWLPLSGQTEGFAASNGATGRLGPPSFEDARLDCRKGETVLKLKLRY